MLCWFRVAYRFYTLIRHEVALRALLAQTTPKLYNSLELKSADVERNVLLGIIRHLMLLLGYLLSFYFYQPYTVFLIEFGDKINNSNACEAK